MAKEYRQNSLKGLNELTKVGRDLLKQTNPSYTHRDYAKWVDWVAEWIDNLAPNSGLSAEWSGLGDSGLVVGRHYYDDVGSWMSFKDLVNSRLVWLGKLGQSITASRSKISAKSNALITNKVFLVHGHNEAVREKVARFIEKLKLEPIILHEQPNKGRTIIEKFIDYSDVSFSIILLTGDDRGGTSSSTYEEQKLRARQNVIFELGFFVGRLGREKACALYEEGVEIPSDYQGVIFIKLDKPGAWKMLLAKEMKEAELPFDMNDAI